MRLLTGTDSWNLPAFRARCCHGMKLPTLAGLIQEIAASFKELLTRFLLSKKLNYFRLPFHFYSAQLIDPSVFCGNVSALSARPVQ
jgi:hypothetical protein